MRALVTGGAGFIGSYLIRELLQRKFEVVVFDMADYPESLVEVWDKITYVRGDLGSEADLYRVMMRQGITDVFHLGALLAGPCEDNPIAGFKINFRSTKTLLDASLSSNVQRFIFLSSISVFGRDATEPVTDAEVKNPETIYGQTKLAGEHLLLWYARKHGLDTRALRFTWVFGPGRTNGITALYSSLLLDAIARGERLEIPNPDEAGDWLYIDDAIKAIMTLWEAETPTQRIYNIAGGVHTIRDVVNIARKLKPGSQVVFADQGKNQSPYQSAYDDSVARTEIGWKPDYSIEDAVKKHLEIVSI